MSKIIPKPEGYVSHRVVYDPHPKLIINLNYTVWQAQMDLGEDWQEFKVEEDGDNLIIREV